MDEMLNLIKTILFIIITTVIVIDVVPIILTWISRIHIGRYTEIENWSKSITNRGIKWLNKTPKVKITDNNRLIVIDILKGNYISNDIQHWQEASLLLGLGEYLKKNKDESMKKEIKKYLSSKFDKSGQWINKPEHVDGAILAYAIMKLDFIDLGNYKPALDYTWNMIRDHIGEDKTVRYRKFMTDYRYVDTIGFICPFLVCYGKRYNNKECIDLALRQIKEYDKYGILNEQNIPCHAYRIKNKAPLGLYGWGRGLGWYAIGLIDTWNELELGSEYKEELKEYIVKLTKSYIGFQNDNGSWSWTVTRPETRADSSTTATLSWFLLNASKIDEVSKECKIAYEKSIKYLMSVTKKNGVVDFSQGDTKDIGVYSLLFEILPFTQGFCIRCINKES